MSIKRSTYVMSGEGFFESGVPIYVNRAYETFEMIEHSHEFVEMTYVSEGAGTHYIAGEIVPVEHGTLFFIPVGQSHVFRPMTPKKERPLIVYNCLFPASFLTELRSAFPQASDICDLFVDESLTWFAMKDPSGEYHAKFREMYREYSVRPPGFMAVLTSIVMQTLAGLYRHKLQLETPAGDQPQWRSIDEALAYIDHHYANELKLSDLAAQSNLSERQFSRLFRRQTGMSFTDYMQSTRMESACRLLASSRSTVGEVANTVGYADLKFFHRLFKKKVGVTPRQYRNTVHGATAINEEKPRS
ncbi:AraC-like DNA-binding protein [Paenibacillus cellulosilyticus]|uniref:AraC-like DNA-binding protein n=1 Tax=Paenibacillus cellulosilyticus TaxID=375489 RepID=A0A2V2YZ50_9BACL|nr:AraC family transcriptional regulator [Paenibacillus cellulosilyticus]PWW05734.1 AraC-like DNA-binding protein [Paenibacillus cellulosilyticus]QKS45253.1 helix-turn-helix transcriptional regulator [Paenibacillus cellulosilyticus]